MCFVLLTSKLIKEQLHKQIPSCELEHALRSSFNQHWWQISLLSLTSDSSSCSHFGATKNPHVDWWKGTSPLTPWPQIKKKFLQIHKQVLLSALLQYIHLEEVNPRKKSHPSNTLPFYVSYATVNYLLLLVQVCWCSAWEVMGQIVFLLVAVLCCEIYAFPLGKGLLHTKRFDYTL